MGFLRRDGRIIVLGIRNVRPKRLNPYQRAMVYRMIAYVAYGAGDVEEAITYFQKVLDEKVLSLRDDNRIRFNIAQLYAGQQDWNQVNAWLGEWLRYTDDPAPLGFYLMAIASYQLGDFDLAIERVQTALDTAPQPNESWMRLLSALYAQKEDYTSATPVLEELLMRWPKKVYWVQLSLIYGARADYKRALAVQQVAYAQGFLTEEAELMRLARSLLYNNVPYRAALVLETALEEGKIKKSSDVYELLANSWIAAREYEKSLPPLRTAAKLSDDGNLYVRLGQVHMQREQWDEAAGYLGQAIAKGGLKSSGNAELLLGISHYNNNNVGRARSHFTRARNYDATRTEAERWITHLETEQSQAG